MMVMVGIAHDRCVEGAVEDIVEEVWEGRKSYGRRLWGRSKMRHVRKS